MADVRARLQAGLGFAEKKHTSQQIMRVRLAVCVGRRNEWSRYNDSRLGVFPKIKKPSERRQRGTFMDNMYVFWGTTL